MNTAARDIVAARESRPSPDETLRNLFLTLFLRGRGARGMSKATSPRFVAVKLWLVLVLYVLFGLFALALIRQPLFTLSIYLHASTFVFVGMYVASSCGDMLFNKEEADILLHRPITPGVMLRAKITVLVQVSLWMSAAFNLPGLLMGAFSRNGSWLFPIAHSISLTVESVFCASFVVVTYQLCLRWFGRERLDGLMTTVQVIVSIAMVSAGQIMPRMLPQLGKFGDFGQIWWIGFLPPAWFAGIDAAIVGQGPPSSWVFALIGVAATVALVVIAVRILSQDYEIGLQNLNAVSSAKPGLHGRRWIDTIANAPPLRWWMRDPAERAVFALCIAYMVRDRGTKLVLYPSLASTLMVPVVLAFQFRFGGIMLAFAGASLATIPMLALSLLRYSQQWQAADLFRVAPLYGPAPLCHGARRAVIFFLGLPSFCLLITAALLLTREDASVLLVLPGLILLPAYSLIPCRNGEAIPFSEPGDTSRSTRRGLFIIVATFASLIVSGIAYWAQSTGWLRWFLAGECALAIVLYVLFRGATDASVWQANE